MASKIANTNQLVDGERYRANFDAIFRKMAPKPPLMADYENPVFDGPEPRKEKPREFMKTYTEGDE